LDKNILDYLYGSFNRRLERKAETNGSTTTGGESTEFFFYDGQNVVLDALDPDGASGEALPGLLKTLTYSTNM
jgi:hypothetical protein